MSNIAIAAVRVPSDQRECNPAQVARLAEKMRTEGYNPSYPITIEWDGAQAILVDGGHRLAAAQAAGIAELPYLVKPAGVSRLRHSIRCNSDGADTRPDDVFDFASRIAALSAQGWRQEDIGTELGWDRIKVQRYAAIRSQLHSRAWAIAHVPNFQVDGTNADDDLGTSDVPKGTVQWSESHFRALLQHLPCPNGDNAMMRAQVAAVRELMERGTFTAKVVGEVARRYAWHTALAREMTQVLAPEVGYTDRARLLRNVQNNVYGKAENDRDHVRFQETLAALNERALGVRLYHDDALQRLPQLANESVDLVVADPPYNVTDYAWDHIGSEAEYVDWMWEWLAALRPKLRPNYHLFIFCDPSYAAAVEMALRSADWPVKSRIIWEYRNLVNGRDVTDKFIQNWQMCFHIGTHALNWPPKWTDERFMVQQHATPQSNFIEGKNHPTAKPLSLIRLLVSVGSKPGDVVLDPFAGGGTTGRATSAIGQRQCILIEREDMYCAEIEKALGIRRSE